MKKWNNFKGAAKRIEDIDLPRIGHEIGVGEDVIHAVLDVESRGRGFDSKNRPIILFEPHIFYRQLRGTTALSKAEAAGLAYPKWRRNYPKDSYPRLAKAIAIAEAPALRSCSWGLGQVMGFNHGACGFANVQSFVRSMMDDEDNHLEAMIAFIVTNGLDDELRALEAATTRRDRIRAAAGFARGYNGPAYEKNRYHIRIADRLEWWRGKPDTPWSPTDAVEEERDNDEELSHRSVMTDEEVAALVAHENAMMPKQELETLEPGEKTKTAIGGIVVGGTVGTVATITVAWYEPILEWITSLF